MTPFQIVLEQVDKLEPHEFRFMWCEFAIRAQAAEQMKIHLPPQG